MSSKYVCSINDLVWWILSFRRLGTSCNRTDDENGSMMSPQFDDYPSGAGENDFILVDQ